MLSDDLKDTIWEYAHDYDLREYQRHTRWPDVATAMTAFETAVRADQIAKTIKDAVDWARSCSGESADAAADYIEEMGAQLTEGEKP